MVSTPRICLSPANAPCSMECQFLKPSNRNTSVIILYRLTNNVPGEAIEQLLLAILGAHDIQLDYAAVSKTLGCTPRAVQEQLRKLKLKARDGNSPASPTSKNTSNAKSSPGRKRKVASDEVDKNVKRRISKITKKQSEDGSEASDIREWGDKKGHAPIIKREICDEGEEKSQSELKYPKDEED